MSADVKPLTAFIVIITAIAFFFGHFYLTESRDLLPAPRVITTNFNNDLAAVVADELYLKGAQNKKINLSEFGVLAPLIGDLQWLNDDEILVRTGESRVPIWQRIGEPNERVEKRLAGSKKTIQRCHVEAKTCKPFSAGMGEMNYPFSIAVSNHDLVAIAESSAHRVVLYNKEGEQLDVWEEGMEFPSRVRWVGEQLYVVNTQRKLIQELEIKNARFQTAKTIFSSREIKEFSKFRFPMDFYIHDENIYLLAGNSYFEKTAVIELDNAWQFKKHIENVGNLKMQSLTFWNDQLYVNSVADRKIKLLVDGTLENVEWPTVNSVLNVNVDKARLFDFARYGLYVVMLLAFIVGLWVGIKQALAALPTLPSPTEEEKNFDVHNAEIDWVNIDPKYVKQIKLLAVVLVLMPILMVVTAFMSEDGLQADPLIIAVMGITLLMCLLILRVFLNLAKQRIGVYRDKFIVLYKNKKRYAVGTPERLMFHSALLAIDDVSINLGQGNLPLFDQKQLVDKVYPLLKDRAVSITQSDIQALYIKNMKPLHALAIAVCVVLTVLSVLWLT